MSTACHSCLGMFFAGPSSRFISLSLSESASGQDEVNLVLWLATWSLVFFSSWQEIGSCICQGFYGSLTILSLEKVIEFCIHKFVWSLWFLCILQESDQWKSCETGPAVFFYCDEKNLLFYWYSDLNIKVYLLHPNWLCQYLLMFKMIKMETGFLEFLIVTGGSVFPVLGRDIAKKMISRLFGYSSQLFYWSPSLKFPRLCFPFNLSWW